MKVLYKILLCVLVSVVAATGAVSAQQAADKGKQSKTEIEKTGAAPVATDTKDPTTTGDKAATQGRETPKPAEPPKRWGLQMTTGRKWYQVSIKFVM